MVDDPPKKGEPPKDEKRDRLAAALRENLKRRKAQSRARRSGESGADQTDPEPDGER